VIVIPKTIKGEFSGIVTRRNVTFVSQGGFGISFMIKLDQKSYGIPEEITVLATATAGALRLGSTIIQEGDELLISGEIRKMKLSEWGIDVYQLKADHIFNKTTNYGF